MAGFVPRTAVSASPVDVRVVAEGAWRVDVSVGVFVHAVAIVRCDRCVIH
jgi:hypothetical protein